MDFGGERMLHGIDAAHMAAVFVVTAFAAWLVQRGGGTRLSVVFRASIVAALATALAGPVLTPPIGRQAVDIVDRSASVAPGAAPGAAGEAENPPDRSPARPSERRPLIDFGGTALSDVFAALDLAGRAVGDGGRVVLHTDGHATGAEPALMAAELDGRGIRVDVVPLPSRFDDVLDVGIFGLEAPNLVRVGDPLALEVGLRSTLATSAEVVVTIEGREAARSTVEISEFERTITLELPPPTVLGPLALEVEVSAEGDVAADNDQVRSVIGVVRAPKALVIGEGTAVVTAAGAIGADGIRTSVVGPARVPIRAEDLLEYDAMVLVDTPADALALDQRAAIERAVESLGIGLVLAGGRRSFALGGWRGTALERLSPLTMEPAPRTSREAVTLLLLIDRSASMGGGDGRVTKLDLAREASLLAAEALEPQDRVGIIAYDEIARWILETREVGVGLSLSEIEVALAGLDAAGGTRIHGALELGLGALAGEAGAARHAVLLSDGRDVEEDIQPSNATVAAAAERGVTLSTIAIGTDADAEFLTRLARLGRGRFHSALDPSDLPGLVLEEGEIVGGRVERRTPSRAVPASSVIDADYAAIDFQALPVLEGHLALEPRPNAQRILDTDGGDPLLVAGQRGLGRVVAWTSDLGQEWTASWVDDGSGAALWGRMVRSIARRPALPFAVRAVPAPDGLLVQLESPVPGGPDDPALIDPRLFYTDTLGVTQTVHFTARRISTLEARVDVPAGDAVAAAILHDQGTDEVRWPIMLRRDPNPENLPVRDPHGVLADIAEAGGGELHSAEDSAIATPADESRTIPLWPLLVAYAAIAWPIDIAIHLRDRAGGRRPARPSARSLR